MHRRGRFRPAGDLRPEGRRRAGAPAPTLVAASTFILGLDCPSPTQCTTVGIEGKQATFNPQTGIALPASTVTANAFLLDVACPTDSQ